MDARIKTDVMDMLMEVGAEMEDMGLVNTFEGNLSVLDAGLLYVTPARTSKKKLNHDNICVFDESSGTQLSGGKASSETKMHRGAYTVKAGVGAAIHCHAPYLTAHAITHVPLDFRCHPELLFHFKDIPVVPYAMPGSEDMIETARPYLLHRNLVLLGNHGVLSIASTLALACQRIVAAEKFARVMSIARQIGTPVDIPETEIMRLLARELEQ
ncbi:MAG: class II aldolase/adducin family protein [Lachnospiraceae bacterium]|jgi:L-fuculose-phosphate aldolase|nr:class II aldolase/adducin family protein [Lachnospiraceae bacterium]